ncbi:MAG: hypothetical protein ABGX04_11660 [Myxococcales bacterium]
METEHRVQAVLLWPRLKLERVPDKASPIMLFERDPLEIRFRRRVPLTHPAQPEVDGA